MWSGPHRHRVKGGAWCGSQGVCGVVCVCCGLLWGMWHGVGQRVLLAPSTAVAAPACTQNILRSLLLWGVMSRGSDRGGSPGYAMPQQLLLGHGAWLLSGLAQHACMPWCTGDGMCMQVCMVSVLSRNLRMCGHTHAYPMGQRASFTMPGTFGNKVL